MAERITVKTLVHAPIEHVWNYWTEPEHIMQWNAASDDWHTPSAMSDLREGGLFSARMEAEGENSIEMQREGWQAILDHFKRHAESQG